VEIGDDAGKAVARGEVRLANIPGGDIGTAAARRAAR
jgi:hypothetical protein